MNIFQAQNLVKKYANHLALDNVSIDVPEGSVFGLLGPNGAGKTTLIRIINQITAPDSGTILFNGEKLKLEHTKLIGYLPEERGLYKKMKVGELSLYLAQLKGLSRQEAIKRLKYWFEKFEIEAWWNKKVEELSKGMQQKIQFIVTVLHKPKLLIFDEPFSGFDPINTNILKTEILNLKKEGATIIFSTHNMNSVEEICDNITLINKSKKILEGTVPELRNKFKSNNFEIQFKGKANLLSATLTADYSIEKSEFENNITTVKIKLLKEISSNQLISHFINFGEINSFKELLPSMNDIFISAVEYTNIEETKL